MSKTVSKAISDAVLSFAREHGNAAVTRKTDIPSSTVSRWVKENKFALHTKNLDAVCKIDQVRSAAAEALLKRPQGDATSWEAIAGELSELLSPAAGWNLVHKLRDMVEIGMLDSEFSLLEGAIRQRRNADTQDAVKRKLPKTKTKRKRS